MISSFLNTFKQLKLKVESYLQNIIDLHKEVRTYIGDKLKPLIY